TIDFDLKALVAVGGSDESRYYTFKVLGTHLKSGYNIIAVSVHQNQATSSDLTFDMEVTGELKTSSPILSNGIFPIAKIPPGNTMIWVKTLGHHGPQLLTITHRGNQDPVYWGMEILLLLPLALDPAAPINISPIISGMILIY
ncbi:MAG: hypothetical protein M3421_02910, partial [Bacteroidota bacterium]|nr:hypothetical protein [Bacteroidota bacterium]